MRKILLLLLVLPVLCFAQDTIIKSMNDEAVKEVRRTPNSSLLLLQDKLHGDTLNTFVITDSAKTWKAILIDNELVYDLKNIKVEDIASISILKDSSMIGIYGNPPVNTQTLVIYTKQFMEKDKDEYEAIVLDPGFESFLLTQTSKDFYSETYLKTKNVLMVTEWNARHSLPLLYDPNIYEVSIDYNPQTDYGLEVEYRLYMFFRFMEKEHRMSLIDDGRLTR
ncbi:hypothetical protein M2451_002184 [Dysgonomonas sp. PFB1-18]|uniref:DUF6146 family protein n=1 Tax=unclassified Dysgonomonas TaxID=2630389 RepID=UPI00247515C9|nr:MULTISPECIES: DUF6146 family protein [unclassified Dysgonomonas]MDL2302931.1 DUF6146 family protein [Dysgonomonas sp. OttesenSCG-928-D17]MDH6309813.1 hypothetical protein [Dysgonomonas sp. PF1-14]MDH6339357.1 hypothetical protein [Dysgonomonas sp. PF1-16]MDH6380856.1 hypothetical protein [Dysgonomonas sp. PFB1-18]MDH6397865.1 hypothetical protein [Dysgonomonas sp. PF1-23]